MTANGAAIAAFNAAVAADPRVEQVLLPLRDGLTLIRRVDDRDAPMRAARSATLDSALALTAPVDLLVVTVALLRRRPRRP